MHIILGPVWYNFPTSSAQSFDASDTEPPLLKRGIIDSVTLDMFTRNMVYKVVYKDDTNNNSIVDEVGEKELAYGASCPVHIVADSDAAAEEVDEEEKKEDDSDKDKGGGPKNSQEGTVLYAEPSPNEPGKVVYTIMIHGEEGETQSRYETGIKAERVKYRKVVNEYVIDSSINKEVGLVRNDKLKEADRISPLTLQTEEEEVPVSSITLKSSPEEGQINDSNNTKRSSVSTLGDGGSSTTHRQSMGGSTRGSGGNDTDVGSYMRGCYGSKGHDYTRDTSRDSRPIDEAAVDRLLADRLHYKRKHMFDKADELKDELLNVHGVTVRDNRRDGTSKTYTTESVGIGRHGSFDSGVDSLTGREYGTKGHGYTRDTFLDSRPIDEAAVDRLLSDRLYYRKKHMYDKADELQDELLMVHGVTVRDGYRKDGMPPMTYTTERFGNGRPENRQSMEEESVGGSMRHYGVKGHDYVRDTSRDSRLIDEAAVDKLLSDRLYYRKKHMFDKDNELRVELLHVHGVSVWDGTHIRAKTYTTENLSGGATDRLDMSVPMWLQNIGGSQELFGMWHVCSIMLLVVVHTFPI